MKIYVDTPLPAELKQTLVNATTADEVFFKDELPDDAARREIISDADIVFGNPRPAEWIAEASKLKWMQLYSTGFEYYRHTSTSAIITNMQDYYSAPCAETMIAGILALYRGVDKFSEYKLKREWVGHLARRELNTLTSKKVIILGKGMIATNLAKRLSGFECEIKFFARQTAGADLRTVSDLKALLPTTDIVIGCLPGTDETKGLITKELIESLSPNCIFCNVGRGNLVADENALVWALKNLKIAGAVLDVTVNEPLPDDDPFWDCPNTILTQHSGGGSLTEHRGILDFFLDNYRLFKEGKPLKHVITLTRGY